MNPLHEKRRALGQHRACFGSDSTSTSTQNTTNNLTDARTVNTSTVTTTNSVDQRQDNRTSNYASTYSNASTTTANSGNTTSTNVNMGDFGAIAATLKNNSQNSALVFALADKLAMSQAAITTKNLDLARELSQDAAGAFSDAAGTASGTKNLITIALMIAGVVGLAAVAR